MGHRGRECRLPRTARMRYWKPAQSLAHLVSGYHLYAVETPSGEPHSDVFQPAWANLRVQLGEGSNWRVQPRGGGWHALPEVALFGPSGAIYRSESETGLVVGIGLRPAGWLRLVAAPASAWADRVGAADEALAADAEPLRAQLCGVDDDDAVPQVLDRWLTDALSRSNLREAQAGAVEAALLDPEIDSVAALADRAGLSVRALERLAQRAFGFPPKLLLRRARFLRSLHAIRRVPAAARAGAIDESYVDYSHFVRDARQFLGMAPGAFLRLETPLLDASLKLRDQVLGSPAQALGTRS